MKDKLTFKELWQLKKRMLALRDSTIAKRDARFLSLIDLSIDEIVEKFNYRSMQKECADFCSMFAKDKPCHEFSCEELNCFGCLCPNYDFNISFDKEIGLYKLGSCRIGSKFRSYKSTKTKTDKPKEYLVLNCTNCNLPHSRIFIKKIIEKTKKKLISDK